MTTIAKTFFLGADIFCPKRIKEELGEHYSMLEDSPIKGTFYFITDGVVLRYDWNSFEIMAYDKKVNYQIRSQLENILSIKLIEPC